MYKNIDFAFASIDEICLEIGSRFKLRRIARNLQQEELARMAGVSKLTVLNLEKKGNVTFTSMIRIAQALGSVDEFQTLLKPRIVSIDDMERAEIASTRKRIKKKPRSSP